jgi:hypothetical protein
MNKKIAAIVSLVLGIGVFIAGLAVSNSPPALRSTEDSKIAAVYDAPAVQAKTTNDSNTLAEVAIRGRTGMMDRATFGTGKAHVRRADSESSADNSDSVVSPSNGLFSTASALSYNPMHYTSKVPNVQYIKSTCPLCSR